MRLSRDETLMLMAGVLSLRSTCNSKNAAILAHEGRVIATGYNGAPAGLPHCLESGCLPDEKGHCQRTVHAEANSIAMAAKYGVSTLGSTLYCTTAPCPTCSKLLVNSGVLKVVFSKPYLDMSGVDMLLSCNIEVAQFDNKEMKVAPLK